MRAVVINELGNPAAVGLEDVASPRAGPGEVLVDVHACGVNFTDYLSLDGRYQNNPPPPFTPGKDAAGIVVAVGAEVTRVQVGDRVIAHVTYGGLAEQVVCPQARCFELPADVSFDDAAGLGLVAMTAYFACKVRGAVKPGDRVLINGASGGVGLALVSMAKALGAEQVLAGLPTPGKSDAAFAAGADACIDLSCPAAIGDLREAVASQVESVTDGHGVDLVIDLLGGDYFDAGMRCVTTYGRIVVTGFASGAIASVRTNYLLLKNIAVVGMTLQTFLDEHSDELGVAQTLIFNLLAQGRLNPNVTAIYPFERFREAIERIERREVVGKSIVRVREPAQ